MIQMQAMPMGSEGLSGPRRERREPVQAEVAAVLGQRCGIAGRKLLQAIEAEMAFMAGEPYGDAGFKQPKPVKLQWALMTGQPGCGFGRDAGEAAEDKCVAGGSKLGRGGGGE